VKAQILNTKVTEETKQSPLSASLFRFVNLAAFGGESVFQGLGWPGVWPVLGDGGEAEG
jgi:hypothetical protein